MGNNIGTTSDGTHAAGNGYAGVRVAVNSNQVTIRANLIANNANGGVTVDGSNVSVLYNTLSANYWGLAISGGLPIDLGNDGATPNGSKLLPGPNAWQPYPVVTAASGNLIHGNACTNCGVRLYRAIGNPAQPRRGPASWPNFLKTAWPGQVAETALEELQAGVKAETEGRSLAGERAARGGAPRGSSGYSLPTIRAATRAKGRISRSTPSTFSAPGTLSRIPASLSSRAFFASSRSSLCRSCARSQYQFSFMLSSFDYDRRPSFNLKTFWQAWVTKAAAKGF